MNLKDNIKETLEETYHINFDVKQQSYGIPAEYLVKPSNSNSRYFDMFVIVKEDSRLTIECKPETYGAEFVECISRSQESQRSIFCDYWEQIAKLGKVVLKINEVPCDREHFVAYSGTWNKFDLRFTKAGYYDVDNEDRNTVISSYVRIICGMMLSLVDYEISGCEDGYSEGSATYRISKKYERNPLNRTLCLCEKGYKCCVCGMDFEKMYGQIGKEFIHVHHSMPVSMMGEGYVVNPSKELFPVCANCHAMLHRKNPPYTIEELKEIILSVKNEGEGKL